MRQVPRHLSVKVRRYYEYYYTQAAVFEEAEILDPLPPILHNDVVSFVTQVTLLKVPLFKRLDPTIYKYILPLLKPLSLSPNDDVYVRGQESANLCFLVKGELVGLSPTDDNTIEIRITKERYMVYDAKGENVLMELEGPSSPQGCFGHTVMQAKRRRETCCATVISELLTIDKDAIAGLFDQDPANAMTLCRMVELAHQRPDALVAVMSRVRMLEAPREDQLAWLIQRQFRKYTIISKASKYDNLYKLVHEDDIAAREENNDAERMSSMAGGAATTSLNKSFKALEAKVETIDGRFNSLELKLDELLKRTAPIPSTRGGSSKASSVVPRLRGPLSQRRPSPAPTSQSSVEPARSPQPSASLSPPRASPSTNLTSPPSSDTTPPADQRRAELRA